MNDYLQDAVYFMRRVASVLHRDMPRDDLYDAILYFSLGIERFCHAILFDINPVLVLADLTFENTCRVSHWDRVTAAGKEKITAKFTAKPGGDKPKMRTLWDAMTSAEFFSDNVRARRLLILHLADLRNTIAHRPLSEIDTRSAERFCLKYFCPLIASFAKDLTFDTQECFAGNESELSKLADAVTKEDDLTARVSKLLETHRKRWENKQSNPDFVSKTRAHTATFSGRQTGIAQRSELIECPACRNDAVVFLEPDEEPGDGGSQIVGEYPARVHCFYCGLTVASGKDFEEFEQLGFPYLFEPDTENYVE